jgi:hypothetical protein
MVSATFWATFSQPHLVTLFVILNAAFVGLAPVQVADLLNRAVLAGEAGEAVPDSVLPGGLVEAAVRIDVFAAAGRDVVHEFAVVDVAIAKP